MTGDLAFLFVRLGNVPSRSYTAIRITEIIKNKIFCTEHYIFGQFLCPSSGVYSLYTQQLCMSYRFIDSFRVRQGWSHILILLEKELFYRHISIIVSNIFQGNPSSGRLD